MGNILAIAALIVAFLTLLVTYFVSDNEEGKKKILKPFKKTIVFFKYNWYALFCIILGLLLIPLVTYFDVAIGYKYPLIFCNIALLSVSFGVSFIVARSFYLKLLKQKIDLQERVWRLEGEAFERKQIKRDKEHQMKMNELNPLLGFRYSPK